MPPRKRNKAKEPSKTVDILPTDPPITDDAPPVTFDDEVPFPRGGGGALTPLEHRAVRQRALAENDSGLFDEGDAEPSGGKRKRAATSAAAPPAALGEVAERAHALRRRDLVTGVRVLGAVVERFSDRLELQLPGRALGSVAVGEASDELAELVADGSSTAPDLRKLFEVGEVVPCVVLPPTAQQTAGRPAVPLTLRLSAVQGPFLGELENCPAGVPVWASVRSRESHGAVMRTGGKAGGFLGAEGAQLKRWRAHLCVTAKPTRGGAPLQLVRFGGDATAAPLPHRALPRLEGFVAGMLVGATVEAALPNGLRVRVGQYFEGTIEEESLGRTVRDWQRAPELRRGAKIVARLLWAQPELKRLGLSLAPHLVACARYGRPPPPARGARRASTR